MLEMRAIFFNILLFFACDICAQRNGRKPLTFYDTYPWQGQRGYNCGVTWYGRPALDAGIMLSDLPKPASPHYSHIKNGWVMANQNFFFNTELTLDRNNQLLAGPKAGYEINYVFFTGRLSDVCYIKPAGGFTDNRLLLEGGATMFGFVNLCYGYSLPTQPQTFDEAGRHRLTLRVNIFPTL